MLISSMLTPVTLPGPMSELMQKFSSLPQVLTPHCSLMTWELFFCVLSAAIKLRFFARSKQCILTQKAAERAAFCVSFLLCFYSGAALKFIVDGAVQYKSIIKQAVKIIIIGQQNKNEPSFFHCLSYSLV